MKHKEGRRIEDDRFKHIATDPRFRGVPRSQRKVKIDNRFASMFDDKRFKLKYVMDKRGRPIHSTTTEDLKKYYAVESSSESENEDENREECPEGFEDDSVESKSKRVELAPKSADDVGDASEDEASEDSEEEEGEDDESDADSDEPEEPERDPARGIGNVETSSEDESSEEELEDEEREVAWGELDRDAPKSDNISRRLALCNLDWDKLCAQDLFVLLDSFRPPGGVVQRVSIYPSEFGKQRMAVEQVSGPAELVEVARGSKVPKKSSEDDEEVDAKSQREALRQYQLNRLRYYYAIAECDSAQTADHLYRELDGREYESSGTCLDLRFVPDDMTFDEEPTSVADSIPDLESYKPLNFVTSALQSVNVQLTWDEDDPRRTEAMQRAFKEDGAHDDLNVYLASSSSESEGEATQREGTDEKETKKKSMEAQIQKYRDLLKSLEDGEKKPDDNDDDVEMEVTWNPGLSKQVEDLVKKKQEHPEGKTPFQEYLEKRKEKRKLKRSLNKKGAEAEDSDTENSGTEDSDTQGDGGHSEQAFSDDELPSDVDLGDGFFKKDTPLKSSKERNKSKKKRRKQSNTEEAPEDKETTKTKAELELLLMDDEDDGRKHFSLKKLLEENQQSSKKKRKRKAEKEATKADGDDFQVDLADPRFSALYDSHEYNVDPTDPHFKKTKGMEALLTEKQRRRLTAPEVSNPNVPNKLPQATPQTQPQLQLSTEPATEPKPSRQSLSSLASSVKRKVQQMKSKSKKLPS